MDSEIINLVVLALGIIVFIALLVLSSLGRAPIERGLTPLYEGRGAVIETRGFLLSGTGIPLNRLAFYEEFVVIGRFASVVIRYSEIEELDIQPAPVTGEIKLVIRQSRRHRTLYIVTQNRRKVVELLQARVPASKTIG